MDNPVDYQETPGWRDPQAVDALAEALARIGFLDTRERYSLSDPPIRAQGFLHREERRFALVYERDRGDLTETWCEIGLAEPGARYHIATGAPEELEWASEDVRIFRQPGATPDTLLEVLEEQAGDRLAERQERQWFGLIVHGRLMRQWAHVHGPSPLAVAAEADDRDQRIAAWTLDFVRDFRALGFLARGEDLTDEELAAIINDYDEPLFRRFPAVEIALDDFDDFQSLFSLEQVESFPEGAPEADLRLLALLEPERVWWSYRDWWHELDGREMDPEVAFSTGGERHTIRSRYQRYSRFEDVWLRAPDLAVSRALDRLLDAGARFVTLELPEDEDESERDDGRVCVLHLSKAERAALRERRGWDL